MTAIPLGVSNYSRIAARTPKILLRNTYLEKDPTNLVDGLMRLQRPGLAPYAAIGDGPIRGTFRKDGTFGGDRLVVSGDTLYRNSTSLGALTGTGRVTIAASATRALIATGGICYSTDGATVTQIVMPDGELVSSVEYIDGYFILTVANSQHFFWLAPGDTNPDALNFASAENSPDNLRACKRLLDELWFMGTDSTEVFQVTGNADAPFQRIAGRLYEKGCFDADTIGSLDNTLFWVGNDGFVYRADTQPVRISDHSVEEMLQRNAGGPLSAWAFAHQGHTFYPLTVGDLGTVVYDVENANWALWDSYGRTTWRAHLGMRLADGSVVAGDDTTNNLWLLDQERSNDNGTPLVREVMGGIAIAGQPVPCNSVTLFVATGWAPATGDASDPMVYLNYYDDGGSVLSGPWIELSIGQQGQYGYEVTEWQLGSIFAPGRLFILRMTADTLFRISYMKMNEA